MNFLSIHENLVKIHSQYIRISINEHTHMCRGQQAITHSLYLHDPGMFFTSLKGYLKKKQKTKNMQQKPYVACKAKNI